MLSRAQFLSKFALVLNEISQMDTQRDTISDLQFRVFSIIKMEDAHLLVGTDNHNTNHPVVASLLGAHSVTTKDPSSIVTVMSYAEKAWEHYKENTPKSTVDPPFLTGREFG